MQPINTVLAALGGAAVVATVTTIALHDHHENPRTALRHGAAAFSNVPAAQVQAPAPPAELANNFSALRRSASPSDELPATAGIAHGGPTQGDYGIQSALSRVVGRPGGHPVWLAPGTSGACVVLADGGGGCGPSDGKDGVAHRGIFTFLLPVNGAPETAQGVLPDGATVTAVDKNGNVVAPQVSGQAYSVPAGAASFTLHFSDGTTDTEALTSAAPPALPTTPATP